MEKALIDVPESRKIPPSDCSGKYCSALRAMADFAVDADRERASSENSVVENVWLATAPP